MNCSQISKNLFALLFFLLLVILPENIFGQNRVICGFVYDSISREPLMGASVYDTHLNGCVTDHSGYFCLNSPEDENISISISYVGYEKKSIRLITPNIKFLNISLNKGVNLEGVEVYYTINNIEEIGSIKLLEDEIKNFPSLTGEPDVLKAFQLMAGVQMGDEGSTGLHVRGGSPDQNLYLMDGVPLYYVNHLGGFVSVFDANTIKSAVLFKADFPARYGGRLSSVLDVRLKEGDLSDRKHEVMLGTISSKIFSEGKFAGDQSKYLFSLRRCNLDLFMRPISHLNSGGRETNYYTFYDFMFKTTHTINPKNKITTLIYYGRDKLGNTLNIPPDQYSLAEFSSIGKMTWGNRLGSIRLEKILKEKIKWESSLDYTGFFNNLSNDDEIITPDENANYLENIQSGVEDFAFRNTLHFRSPKLIFYAGLNSIIHLFKPQTVNYQYTSGIIEDEYFHEDRLFQTELNTFLDFQFEISRKITLSTGLYYEFWPGINFHALDPRISGSYKISVPLKIKASYSLTHQFIHLLSSNGSGIPTENWVPSTMEAMPEKASQIALGLYYSKKMIELSIETYYKNLENLIMYQPGVSQLLSDSWEENIFTGGSGEIKGLELSFKKKYGKLQAWINYALSKNNRLFENVNQGKEFPYKYDRRHELKIGIQQEINSRIFFSMSWIYASGNAIQLATQKYPAIDFNSGNQGYLNPVLLTAHYYGGVNSYRTEAYHRLDVGLDIKKQKQNRENTLHLGIYNVYNRMNPYYYYFESARDGSSKLKKFTLFPFIPSISYKVEF